MEIKVIKNILGEPTGDFAHNPEPLPKNLVELSETVVRTGAEYVNLAMFFAFATLYPDAQVLLFFFIPVKIKWMAILDACYFAYIIFFCAASRYWIGVVLPLVALLNFFVFFAPELGRFAKREQTRTKQAAHFHNTTSDSLNFTFEVLTYQPTDTALFEQADYVALSSVNLAPHEHLTWPVFCHFSQTGERLFACSADDLTLPFIMPIRVEKGVSFIYVLPPWFSNPTIGISNKSLLMKILLMSLPFS